MHLPVLFLWAIIVVTAHRRDEWDDEQTLEDCEQCSPGYGLIYQCNSTHSTKCEACKEDEFTLNRDHLDPCRPCSECGVGMYERHHCTDTRDTRCASCVSRNVIKNLDFYDKCSKQQLAEAKFEEELEANEERLWANGIDEADNKEKDPWGFMNAPKPVHHRRFWGLRCWLLVAMLGVGIAALVILILRVCALKRRDPGFSYDRMPEDYHAAVNQSANHLINNSKHSSSMNVQENPMEKFQV